MQPPIKLQGLDTGLFLSRYWQREPLVIRQAVPGFKDPLSPEDLAGLACEEPVESRLVFTDNGQWRIQNGPIPEEDFLKLPDSYWTLMVQSVNQWLPELDHLFSLVSFLPTWRRDDLMVSYATPQSGAGPHFDFYDVFILQGQGSRLWKLGQHCSPETALDTNSGMKILQDFEVDQEFELHSGDLLYIPPGRAHYGISIDNSMSYSLGFRAPSVADMLIGVSDELADSLNEFERYQDSSKNMPVNGLIPDDVIHNIRERLVRELQEKPERIARWFGTTMTAPRNPDQIMPLEQAADTDLLISLASNCALSMNSFSRVAYDFTENTTGNVHVYFDGEHITVKQTSLLIELLTTLSTDLNHDRLELERYTSDKQCLTVIGALYERGTLINESD